MGQQDRTFIIFTNNLIVITLNQCPILGALPGAVLLGLGLCEGAHTGEVGRQEPTGRHHSGSQGGVFPV